MTHEPPRRTKDYIHKQTYGITRSESLTISTGQSFSTAISVATGSSTAAAASTFGGGVLLVSSADGASSVAADKTLILLVVRDGGANAEVEADKDAISMAENFMIYIDILVVVVCDEGINESTRWRCELQQVLVVAGAVE